jgi:hypothetical protein
MTSYLVKTKSNAITFDQYVSIVVGKNWFVNKKLFECLRKYRKRETIESFFEAEKQHVDGSRPGVWRGMLFT